MAINKKALRERLERLESKSNTSELTCKDAIYIAYIEACPFGEHVHEWAYKVAGISHETFHSLPWAAEMGDKRPKSMRTVDCNKSALVAAAYSISLYDEPPPKDWLLDWLGC